MIERILIGSAIILAGIAMVYKTPWLLGIMGRVYWAEKNLGPGGTRIYYKVIGILVIMVGFVVLTNLWDRVIGGAVTKIFGGG